MNTQMAQKEIENKIIIIYTLLEETFKGKEIFNGDSINIAEIMRIRKGKDKRSLG